MFLKKQIKYDEDGNPIEDEEEELEEGAQKSFEGYIKDETIFPSSCIVLQQDDGFLIDRVKNLIEDEVAGTHYNIADMKRRLKKYRLLNESQTAEPSVQQFFSENGIAVQVKDAAEPVDNVWHAIKIFVEREGKPTNFVFGEESTEAKRRLLVQMEQMHRKEMERVRIIMEEGVERELKKQKESHIKANQLAIRQDEKE